MNLDWTRVKSPPGEPGKRFQKELRDTWSAGFTRDGETIIHQIQLHVWYKIREEIIDVPFHKKKKKIKNWVLNQFFDITFVDGQSRKEFLLGTINVGYALACDAVNGLIERLTDTGKIDQHVTGHQMRDWIAG